MPPVRVRFLPAFLTLLTLAFIAAVTLRIAALKERGPFASTTVAEATSTGSADRSGTSPVAGETVVPLEGDASTPLATAESTTSSSRVAREREERYRELLTAPLPRSGQSSGAAQSTGGAFPGASPAGRGTPAAAVQPPGKPDAKPSLLARVVNAITGGPSPPPAQQGPDSGRKKTEETKRERDPGSDTTAPQLLAIDFTPTVVQDGEQTVVAVAATDDLSGIRSIAGNVISPANSLLGFAVSREGETDRFSTRLTIPKNAADGLWHVNYLSVTDNAGNSRSFAWTRGDLPQTAVFRVTSSKADTTPPTLKALWLDRPSMKPGEKNVLFAQADDDRTGVSIITGVFISPQKFARFGFGCVQNGGQWECPLAPPATAECGDWQLEQVQLQDGANNTLAVRAQNPIVGRTRLTIFTDQCDSVPPVITMVTVDPQHVSRPGNVNVTFTVTDDASGVSSVSGFFVYGGPVDPGATPPQFPFFCRPGSDGTSWVTTIPIREFTARGPWRVSTVQVLDKASNLKLYPGSDPALAGAKFDVQ